MTYRILLITTFLSFLTCTAEANRFFLQPPDYDSGPITMTAGVDKVVTHNLGGNVNDYVVYLTGITGAYGDGHFGYGGCDQGNNRRGFYWYGLTDTTITLHLRNEEWANAVQRVRIWRDSQPDFDSGWLLILPGDTGPLVHNVGGDTDDYVVDLQFMDNSLRPHQMLYGGVKFGNKTFNGTVDGQQWGAYWHSLTDTTVNVVRMPDDQSVWFFRGRIFKRPKPLYDSGWLSVAQATGLFIGLDFPPDGKWVYYEQRDMDIIGIGRNHAFYGGLFDGTIGYGSNWDNFFTNIYGTHSIGNYRQDNDTFADQVRIRIYEPVPSVNPVIYMLLLN